MSDTEKDKVDRLVHASHIPELTQDWILCPCFGTSEQKACAKVGCRFCSAEEKKP
jgi:hypothetical protein